MTEDQILDAVRSYGLFYSTAFDINRTLRSMAARGLISLEAHKEEYGLHVARPYSSGSPLRERGVMPRAIAAAIRSDR